MQTMRPHLPVIAVLISALCVLLPAQQTSAGMTGTVTDAQGGAIGNASIRVSEERIGASRETKTDRAGTWELSTLPPGRYTVRVEAPGFRTAVQTAVQLPVRSAVNLNMRLDVGPVEQTVDVRASAPQVNVRDATIGNDFTGLQITQLPIEARNVASLLSLQPGVVYIGENSQTQRTTFGELDPDSRNGSVNGARSDQNNVTLDGVDVNDQQSGFSYTSVLRVTTESVGEFRVVTAGQNADQGRSSGGQVSLVTRGGTNQLHGVLFESHRNTKTSANNFFNNAAGIPGPKLIRNVFGGNLGGPLWRNRAFFFGNYEGRRDSSEATVFRNIPSESLRAGTLQYRNTSGQVRSISPADLRALDPLGIGASSAVLGIFRQFPTPNAPATVDPLNFAGFRFNSPIRGNFDAFTSRLDFIGSDRHRFFGRGNIQTDTSTDEQQLPGSDPRFTRRNVSKGIAAGHDWVLSPNMVNSFRYGFSRLAIDDVGAASTPFYSFGAIAAPVPYTYSNGRVTPVHNFVNDFTWIRNRHRLQAGLNIRLIQNRRYNVELTQPLIVTQFSYLSNGGREILPADIAATATTDYGRAATALMGLLSQATGRFNFDRNGNALLPGAPLRRDYATEEFEGYLQDSWRLRPNLVLNFGVRYSANSPLRELNGNQVAPTFELGDWFNDRVANAERGVPSNQNPLVAYDLAGTENGRTGFYGWDLNNFGPRVSAAWSPRLFGEPGATSIRGGVGLLYDRFGTALAQVYDAIGLAGFNVTTGPAVGTYSVATAPRLASLDTVPAGLIPTPRAPSFPYTIPVSGQPGATTGGFAPDAGARTPYSVLIDFSVQRQLPSDFLVEAAYVGRESRNLLAFQDVATPLDLRDTASGQSLFEALHGLYAAGSVPIGSVARQPYWENIFPGFATTAGDLQRRYGAAFNNANPGLAADTPLSATQTAYHLFSQSDRNNPIIPLSLIDRNCAPACSKFGNNAFFSPQALLLVSWRSIAPASYHSAQLMVRKRFSEGVQFDLNYTLSKSLDWVSGTERTDVFSNSYLVNSLNPEQLRGPSDFDLRHQVNGNWIARLPFGRGRAIGRDVSRGWDALIGGWQLAGIYRWTSGFPVSVVNGYGRSVNYYQLGFAEPVSDLPATTRNKGAAGGPNVFENPAAAYSAFGPPTAGHAGTRNNLRGDGYFAVDLGLSKAWSMPWRDSHELALRWEVFNATNTVRFNTRTLSLNNTTPGSFGRYSGTLNTPRVMQFMLRYAF